MELKIEAGDVSLSVEYGGQTGYKVMSAEYEVTAKAGTEVIFPSDRLLINLARGHLGRKVQVLSKSAWCLRIGMPGQLSKQRRAAFFAAVAVSTAYAGSPGER